MRLHALFLGLVVGLGASADLRAADSVLQGLRSREAARREEALRTLLADPGAATARVAASRLLDAIERIRESDRDPVLRGLAARGVVRLGGTKERLAVLESLATEADWRAREAAFLALDGVTDPDVVALAIERAYRSPPPLRARFARALGRLEGDRARRALLGLEEAEGSWVARAGVFLGLGYQPSVEAVERCLAGLGEDDPAVAVAARESLGRITGRPDLGSAEAWRAWWKEERADFDPDAPPAEEPDGRAEGEAGGAGADPDDRYRARDEAHLPRYYGIPIRGTRVAFCFDVSASMWGQKFEAAVAELVAGVKSLPSRTHFTVFFFNESVRPWPEDPVPGIPAAKQALIDEIPALEIKSYTNIHDALERALGLAGRGRWARDPAPGVDDVFIVSDGEPNRGRYRDAKGILRSLETLNASRVARIHCISIGDRPRALLKAIAEANGGAHVHRDAAE